MKFLSLPLSSVAIQLIGVSGSPVDVVSLDLEKRTTPIVATAAILENLKHYVQFSAAAYCNSDKSLPGSKVTCAYNACPQVGSATVTNIAYLGFDQSMVSGFVGLDHTNKQIVVAYQGTKSVTSYITDIIFPLESCSDLVSGCKLHSGFQNAWGDVKSNTVAAVTSAKATYPSYTIITTGHSLGGAVATIAGAYLRKAGFAVDIYTFGSPRPGNDDFANYINAGNGAHYRVTHTDDPIPGIPPKWIGYRHSGTEFWLASGGDETVDYTVGDIKICTGIKNEDCNDGTFTLDLTPHKYYLQRVSLCKSTTSAFTG